MSIWLEAGKVTSDTDQNIPTVSELFVFLTILAWSIPHPPFCHSSMYSRKSLSEKSAYLVSAR